MVSWIRSLFNRNQNQNQYSHPQHSDREYSKYPPTTEELKLQQEILTQQIKLQQLQQAPVLDAAARQHFNAMVNQHAPPLAPAIKTKHVFDPNKKFKRLIWPFSKIMDGEHRFNYELAQARKLVSKCVKRRLLTREQWLQTEVDWRTQLIDLFGAAVQYADQRIIMTLEAEQKKKDKFK